MLSEVKMEIILEETVVFDVHLETEVIRLCNSRVYVSRKRCAFRGRSESCTWETVKEVVDFVHPEIEVEDVMLPEVEVEVVLSK